VYRELLTLLYLIHHLYQPKILNDLFHSLKFINRNLNSYRFLIFIKNDFFMQFKHVKPPDSELSSLLNSNHQLMSLFDTLS
jgi:hypothetical protein